MQAAVAERGWKLQEPTVDRFYNLSNGFILDDAIERITDLQRQARVYDDDTINTYLRNLCDEEVATLGLGNRVAVMVVERVIESPGCPTLTQIKKEVDGRKVDVVSRFINDSSAIVKRLLGPLETAIHTFAVELIRGMHSSLVRDNRSEAADVRKRLWSAIKAIESSDDPKAIEILQKNLQKLGDINDLDVPVEGIVFIYKGQAMKFTGNFAPLNQILGLLRYGRGNVKPVQPKPIER